MEQFKEHIKQFYIRDLNKLVEELEQVTEDNLWETVPGVNNSCGILTQHMIGNLNHYIGAGLADNGYERNRERELTNTGMSSGELISKVNATASVIEKALDEFSDNRLDEPFPLYKSEDFTVSQMLMHLYGHFNYHLGQVNYLRRMLAER